MVCLSNSMTCIELYGEIRFCHVWCLRTELLAWVLGPKDNIDRSKRYKVLNRSTVVAMDMDSPRCRLWFLFYAMFSSEYRKTYGSLSCYNLPKPSSHFERRETSDSWCRPYISIFSEPTCGEPSHLFGFCYAFMRPSVRSFF